MFGGSGAATTGKLFIEQALDRGHSVVALVRSLNRFKVASHDHLTVKEGDALSLDAVMSVIDKETDIVVTAIGSNCTLGPSTGEDGTYSIIRSTFSNT